MKEIELNEMSDKDVEKMLKNSDFFSKKYFHDRKFCMASSIFGLILSYIEWFILPQNSIK
jgi:hypothetical protein